MKRTLKMAVIAVVIMLCSKSEIFAQQNVQVDDGGRYNSSNSANSVYLKPSILTLVNNTNMVVYASFVYFDPVDQAWVSRGWRTIQPNSTNAINFGVYEGSVYIHGYQPQGKMKWGSGNFFCIEPLNKAPFRVVNADGADCPMKREYSTVSISTGDNEFFFN